MERSGASLRGHPPRRRRGHEGNGSHRFKASGSVRIGAGAFCGSMGTVERNGIEPDSGKHTRRAGAFRNEFRQRSPTNHDSTKHARRAGSFRHEFRERNPTNHDSARHALCAAGPGEPASRRRSATASEIGEYDYGVDQRKFRTVPGGHGQEEKGQGKR
jgi:hypothetical protein